MMHPLKEPFSSASLASLRVGDAVSLTGLVFTGRDRLHKHLFEGGASPVSLLETALYHCGPVTVADGPEWRVVAAGPTTSIREEPYMARIIAENGVRVIIGKGGMGPATAAACAAHGAVYLEAVGGAAQVLAGRVRRVKGVHFLQEFGQAEAMWVLAVTDFPAVVSIDPLGRNLHDAVEQDSLEAFRKLRDPL